MCRLETFRKFRLMAKGSFGYDEYLSMAVRLNGHGSVGGTFFDAEGKNQPAIASFGITTSERHERLEAMLRNFPGVRSVDKEPLDGRDL